MFRNLLHKIPKSALKTSTFKRTLPSITTTFNRQRYQQDSSRHRSQFWYYPAIATLATATLYTFEKQKFVVHAEQPQYQSTVVSGGYPHCAIVVIKLKSKKLEVMKKAAQIADIVNRLTPKQIDEDEDPHVVAGIGFGTHLWEYYCQTKKIPLPEGFTHYQTRKGANGTLPATPADIILHVKANTRSLCYEVVEQFVESLPQDAIESIADQYGWQYKDGRDLSGFLDGTENPAGDEERFEAAVNPKTGGSFVIHQIWEHNIPHLNKFSIKEQENLVGRRKEWSQEMSLQELPPTSHVARMRDEKFNKIPIVRQSMPFGTIGEPRGLLFIAYANTTKKFDLLLDRMVGKGRSVNSNKEHGDNDGIMKFSECKTGNYFYVPSLEELKKL